MAECVSADEFSESGESQVSQQWLLGFAREATAASLLRHRFPSKVGGRPAWLDPLDLPQEEQLRCTTSGRFLEFLLQVYAPLDDSADAFHRMVYVFVSPQGKELRQQGGVRAFRCQLPRDNPFYSSQPPAEGYTQPAALPEGSVVHDRWRVSEAERQLCECQAPPILDNVQLFPEYELLVDAEGEDSAREKEGMNQLIRTYNKEHTSNSSEADDGVMADILNELDSGHDNEQRSFAAFSARVARAPEQCIRYCFEDGVSPLWPGFSGRPAPENIPPCERCGASRRFEFQILPQLIHYLHLDPEDPSALDWGCIAVYTCSESCSPNSTAVRTKGSVAYAEEFVWVQSA